MQKIQVAAAFSPNLIIHLEDILDINLCHLLIEHSRRRPADFCPV